MRMPFRSLFSFAAALAATLAPASAQVKNYTNVTDKMLENPSPDDWLMFSRTYDAQRYTPLSQINKNNVSQLAEAWKVELPKGTIESIPLVHNGVMYVVRPGG